MSRPAHEHYTPGSTEHRKPGARASFAGRFSRRTSVLVAPTKRLDFAAVAGHVGRSVALPERCQRSHMRIQGLVEEGLRGADYLERVTRLLVCARAEDPGGGPWDAADLQWWSRSGEYDDPERLRFWSTPDGPTSICALFPTIGKTLRLCCLWTRPAREIALSRVMPEVLANVQAIAGAEDASIEIEALDRDTEWRQTLEHRGFEHVMGGSVQGFSQLSNAADVPSLRGGLRIRDDSERLPTSPHPLARRCGPDIQQRLLACSLYRPDLDLSVQTLDAEVAAYCICWADFRNGFAMLEPMRTEVAWKNHGLASALIAEQTCRLQRLGIGAIAVNYAVGNPAAARLYERAGFVPKFERVLYQWRAPEGARRS